MGLGKRIAATLCVSALLLGGLTGCKPGDLRGKDPVAITVWHYYNGAQQQTLNQLVDEFNESIGAQEGVVVEAHGYGKIGELTQAVLDAMYKKVGAEEPPDIFAAYADTAYEINEAGLAANIAQYLTEEEQAAYIPAYLDEGRFDGEGFKIFPVAKSVELLTVNKTEWDAFVAATGASQDGLATWEGLAAIAGDYYRWTDGLTAAVPNDGKAFFGRDAFANYMIIGSYQLGTELFKTEDGKVTLQVDEKVMRRLWDNFYVPYISGYYAAYGNFRSDDLRTGDIAAFVGASSGATYFPAEVTRPDGTTYPIEGKVYPLPNFEGTDPVGVQQGAGMVVTRSVKEKEQAAVSFLKWFTQPEQNLRFCGASGYLPVTVAANGQDAVLDWAEATGESVTEVLRTSLEHGVAMTNEYTLYTSRPFQRGSDARNVVNRSMLQRAEGDRVRVSSLMEGGSTLGDAVAMMNTDANFVSWLNDFQRELETSILD